MMTYVDKLRDPRWLNKRLEIFERDNFTCRDCNTEGQDLLVSLHVHHCWYYGEPWDVPNEYLLTLCADCHDDRQELENTLRREIGLTCAVAGRRAIHAFLTAARRLRENPDFNIVDAILKEQKTAERRKTMSDTTTETPQPEPAPPPPPNGD